MGGGEAGVTQEDLRNGFKELDPYCMWNLLHRLVVRKPGAFGGADGVDVHIEDSSNSTILICDRAAEVYADALIGCRVLVGPCASSTFIRDCDGCTFWVATRQLRTRDCTNCIIYLHSHTEPVI